MSDVKRLYRSRSDRMLGGVAAGLGEFLAVDPTVVRLLFAFALVMWGAGPLVYLVMWFIVPEEPVVEISAPKKPSRRKVE